MPEQIVYHGFTQRYPGITYVLITDVLICQAFDPTAKSNHPPTKQFRAIWDTGATGTVITKKVVNECSLSPINITKVQHYGGISDSNVYLVNIILPNNVGVHQVQVTEGDLGGNADVLIGMNIITIGDFAITNKDGKTMFSFRSPSIEHIDFGKQNSHTPNTSQQQPLKLPQRISRNAPCSCGSGIKFKKCCGKQQI